MWRYIMKEAKNITRFRFSEDEPTPIVRDFSAFVNYLEDTPVALGKKAENIPYKHLVALNELMSSPNRGNTPRTPQRFYPRLHLFYSLAVAGGLFQRAQSGSSIVLEPTDRLYDLRSLSDAGKYFSLLETLWVDCPFLDLSFTAGRGSSISVAFGIEQFLQAVSVSKPGRKLSTHPIQMVTFMLDGFLILCFPILGWYNVRLNESNRKSWFTVASLTPSHLGVAISKILLEERPFMKWNLPYRRTLYETVDYPGQGQEGDSEYVPFVEAFRKICEDGESLDMLPRQIREYIQGNFVFKVSLGKVWRTIALSSEQTLHDLHLAIQSAFRFGNDHLYAFYMDNRRFSDYRFEDPYSENGPWADDAVIGDIDLLVNRPFLYLFDFGDEWLFDVRLVEIRTDEPLLPNPKIVERKGKAPEQYPRYDF
jgi:hypothetical protein